MLGREVERRRIGWVLDIAADGPAELGLQQTRSRVSVSRDPARAPGLAGLAALRYASPPGM